MHQRIGRSAGRLQDYRRIAQRSAREDVAWARATGAGHLGRARAGRFGKPRALGGNSGRRRGAWQGEAERLGNAGHGRGGPHDHAGAGGRHQLIVRAIELIAVELAGPICGPQPAAVGAGAEPRALMAAGQHGADRQHDRRHVGADRAHQLSRNGLVAAADQHHRIERQRAQHFLDVHRHQVAQQHRGRECEGLVQRDGRKHERQRAGHAHAARDRFGEASRRCVARVEIRCGRQHADDRTLQGIVGIAGAFEKSTPQEQSKFFIAILGEARPQALRHRRFPTISDHVSRAQRSAKQCAADPGSYKC